MNAIERLRAWVGFDPADPEIWDALAAVDALYQTHGDFENALANWNAAYPESVFGESLSSDEQKRVTEALAAAGFTSDRVHASWARHVVKCIVESYEPVAAAVRRVEGE